TFRILVLGDSFVEAMHVPLEATFHRLLEQQLSAGDPTRRIEVFAAGISGWGTASELLYFEQYGVRFKPDLVVLAVYPGNDVKNNRSSLEDRFKPVYASDGALTKVEGEWRERHGSGRLPRSQAYIYFRQVLLLRHPELAQSLARSGWLDADAIRTVPQR